MIYTIKKVNKNTFSLSDKEKVFGVIQYEDRFRGSYISNATIKISDQLFDVIYEFQFLWGIIVKRIYKIKLLDKVSNNLLVDYEYFRTGKHYSKITKGTLSLILGEKKYEWLTSLNTAFSSSSFLNQNTWYENSNPVVRYKTTKGFPTTREVEVTTDLDLSNTENALLILWGFYLLPKNRNPIMPLLIAIILCPILLYILVKVFLPFFI